MAVLTPIRTGNTPRMEVLPLAIAARRLGLAHQTLDYYRKINKLTAVRAGSIWLVDPEVAQKELEAAGFYNRRARRRSMRKARQEQ